jgi:hypothetical protein
MADGSFLYGARYHAGLTCPHGDVLCAGVTNLPLVVCAEVGKGVARSAHKDGGGSEPLPVHRGLLVPSLCFQ